MMNCNAQEWSNTPVIAVAMLSLSLAFGQKACEQPTVVQDAMFAPGQVWSYRTRAGEEASTITILRVEQTSKLGVIVHVRIDGIHFRNCTGGAAPSSMEHVPFKRSALLSSVVRRVGEVTQLPSYDEGYRR